MEDNICVNKGIGKWRIIYVLIYVLIKESGNGREQPPNNSVAYVYARVLSLFDV